MRNIGKCCFLALLCWTGSVFADERVDNFLAGSNFTGYKLKQLTEQGQIMEQIANQDLDNTQAVLALGRRYMSNMACLAVAYSAQGEDLNFMVASRELTSLIFDTPQKDQHYHRFLAKIENADLGQISHSNCK